MPTRYDIWKTASPWEEGEDCCDECFSPSHDVPTEFGERAVPDGCKESDCTCHWTDEQWKEAKGEADYDAMRDDRLTED